MDAPIPLNYLPVSARRKLRGHLDVGTEHNWEDLAEALNMKPLDIAWIRGTPSKEGCTYQVIEFCMAKVTIPDLIAALESIGNLAAHGVVCQHYDKMKTAYDDDMAKCRSHGRSVQRHLQPDVQDTLAKQVLTFDLNLSSLPAMPICSNGSGIKTQAKERSCATVLLTYASDAASDCQEIAARLRRHQFDVIVDVQEPQLVASSLSCWAECRFREADFVLVLISPAYKKSVESSQLLYTRNDNTNVNNTDIGSAAASHDHILVRLIYRMMQAEYCQSFLNRRFIPVLLPAAHGYSDIPLWLQDTISYTWPTNYKELVSYIAKNAAANHGHSTF